MLPRLVLLDRDGVLNHDRPDAIKSVAEFVPIAGAAQAVARLNAAGIATALVTNQSILGRGRISWDMFADIQAVLLAGLAAAGGRLDRIYVAPDAPDQATIRRKPGPGMLLEALADFACPADQAVMIGDTVTDAQAAAAAGVRFHLVRTGKGASIEASLDPALRVAVHDDVSAAIAVILGTPA